MINIPPSSVNQDTLPNSIDSHKYLNLIENEITKHGHNLNDSLFISSIIQLLDHLSFPETFNKTLFTHILTFANFNPDKPIKLSDFFKAYFTVYENMKSNRDKSALENIATQKQIEQLSTQLINIKSTEITNSDGITSNSSVQIIFKSNKDTKMDFTQIKGIYVKFGVSDKINFDINVAYSKKAFSIPSINMLEYPIEVYIVTQMQEKLIEKINIKNLLENPIKRNYTYFEMNFIWINSMISFIEKKISLFEHDIQINKDNITVLNTGINHMEVIFKSYFSQIPRSQYSNIISTAIGNEIQISDKLEKVLLKTIGKDIIITYDKLVYGLNKVLLVCNLLMLYHRFDMLTCFFCAVILSFEVEMFMKKRLYYLLMWLLLTIGMDCVYIVMYIGKWNVELQLDVPVIGEVLREISLVIGIVTVVIKIGVGFCLWKMALGVKLNNINRDVKMNEMLLSQGNNNDYEGRNNDFMMKNFRPRVHIGNHIDDGYSIREFGTGFVM